MSVRVAVLRDPNKQKYRVRGLCVCCGLRGPRPNRTECQLCADRKKASPWDGEIARARELLRAVNRRMAVDRSEKLRLHSVLRGLKKFKRQGREYPE